MKSIADWNDKRLVLEHKEAIHRTVKEALPLVESNEHEKPKPLMFDIYYHLSCIATIIEGRASDKIKEKIMEFQRLELLYENAVNPFKASICQCGKGRWIAWSSSFQKEDLWTLASSLTLARLKQN